MSEPTRKIVLGLGNTLNRDEGLGVHALKALEKHLGNRAPEVELLDGGVLGLNLLLFVEEASHLLVLDAINRGKPGGTVVELAADEIPMYRKIKMSEHQITFQEVLALALIRGKLPSHLHMIGAQPVNMQIGTDISPEIADAIPEIVSRAEQVLSGWGLIQ